ncbi:D-sedoheptulose-7-phosphate isomerase [Planomonospora venezuelensis]|uniref:D-sedoheptulose 7-phosphate isomerase n=1 Tax=Planomonospora venezuelensis TaxID=1999 RepID=A0A841DD56_PLAVE|nr:SIS domain-containing protein [Planomonospora venezuelensis]MBB5966364.1 D-sedoheptulose 7-phosphate isomerase [Planomonospora venezuelensis]GIN02809.1 phosphoheptose isomerase [Planomonospora venezuelensis]
MHPHLSRLSTALAAVDAETPTISVWGRKLAAVLTGGGRLLACGNGGSAAEAQHLTAELVGRFRDDRRPYAAIPLHADTSAVSAIGNDFGAEEVYARQVRAHGRPGDVLLCLSTSGTSPNVLAAALAARESGLTTWALTGPVPNPLAELCDDAFAVAAADTATVQEVHLAVIHMLCAAMEEACGEAEETCEDLLEEACG